ncbi:MAG: hypothetical protein KDC34_11440 [Saprospiraceae bacterium]|nr:hypothetical protein [Saprospiraceae bacterium]
MYVLPGELLYFWAMNVRLPVYQEREAAFRRIAGNLETRYRNGSILRLILFFVGIGVLIYIWTNFEVAPSLLATLFLITGFGYLINWHLKIQKSLQHTRLLIEINEREIALLQQDFSSTPDTGADFLDAWHENAIDLDLFGSHSFFHFANRCGTSIGRQRLANYFLNPAEAETIKDRQSAVQELSGQLDWRQDYLALGKEISDNPRHLLLLRKWMESPTLVLRNKLLQAALIVAPFLSTAGLIAWIFYLPWYGALLFFVPQMLILRRTLDRVNDIHQYTGEAEKVLSHYAELCLQIEKLRPESKLIQEQYDRLISIKEPASKAIKKLSYQISQLNVRYNAFAIFLNIFGLWDLFWVLQLEKWKARRQGSLDPWFDALAELEALQSIATLAYNQPHWTFPEIVDQSNLEAVQLGHPLLPDHIGVKNDFAMPTKGQIKLLTGSNMAGKSTFLRTVGLNIVLAMSGSPVCAEKLRLPLLRVYSSMRTQDALHESTSSFFAELKRLKFIIEAVESPLHVSHTPFFLLDEILKGTNSRDRHKGSRALIHQLLRANGAGLIATHDLELGDMEDTSNGSIENLRMEVEIQDGELFFDYKLKKGITQSFNATHLMQKMGIDIS